MKIAGLLFSILTIVALNLILWIGASTDLPRPPWFGVLTGTMDLGLVVSSTLIGSILMRRGRRVFGLLFLANVAVMLGAFVLRLSGVEFSRGVLFGVDLYWLNLYLVGLSSEWREIT